MATATPPAEPAPRKSRKGLAIAIATAVAGTVAGAGVATWHWRGAVETPTAAAAGKAVPAGKAAEAAARPKPGKPTVFVPLEAFTVNLQGGGRDSYLQVGIVVEVADSVVSESLKQRLPVLRGQILLHLAGQNAEDLARPEAKGRLAAELLAKVRQPLPSTPPLEGVEAVHYASFIIQ